MGGHGGLNILPQKRWHVYRDDNRLRVLRDEREFREALEAERQQQQRRVMSDVVTLFKRRKHGITGSPSGALLGDSSASLELNAATSAPFNASEAAARAPPQPKAEQKSDQRFFMGSSCAVDTPRQQIDLRSQGVGRGTSLPLPTASVVDHSRLAQGGQQPAVGCRGKLPRVAASPAKEERFVDPRGEAVVMVKPLKLRSGRIDPLGRQESGHFNFFAAAEREEEKQKKEREKYMLQAGHSTSRQSEFSCIARELKSVWYQAEMPSNRLAREEREEQPLPARLCTGVEAAAEEARRRMAALQRQQQLAGGGAAAGQPSSPLPGEASCMQCSSDSGDSDVCIVKERISGSFHESTVVETSRVSKTKKENLKKDKGRSARKERKLHKRMKRQWMLEALDMQAKLQAMGRTAS
ncbi:hypothetical protein Emag_005552 [Eimeria magna]